MAPRQPAVAQAATMRQVLDLNRIDAFVQVMDAGSFSAAAHRLGLPKSSLSRAVSKLERELGVVLVQRTTRKLAITDAGRLYLERARDALGMLAEARLSLLEAEAEPRGVVRFTAPLDDSEGTVTHALADFAQRYPGIHVECLFTQRRVDLIGEGVDLALRAGVLDDSSLAGKKLGDSPLGLFASPSYLAARGTPRRLQQLIDHDCVLFRGVRGKSRWTLEGRRGKESVGVHGPLNVDELGALCQLAVRGVGIALMPILFGQRFAAKGELVRLLPSMQTGGDAVYLVHPLQGHLPRRVALLRDHLYATLRPLYERCTREL